MCDAAVPAQSTGRPRRYCSRPCKEAAAVWRGIEAVIARARDAGDVEFADERAAWLAQVRADARHGWAGARARVDEANRRTRRRPDDEEWPV